MAKGEVVQDDAKGNVNTAHTRASQGICPHCKGSIVEIAVIPEVGRVYSHASLLKTTPLPFRCEGCGTMFAKSPANL